MYSIGTSHWILKVTLSCSLLRKQWLYSHVPLWYQAVLINKHHQIYSEGMHHKKCEINGSNKKKCLLTKTDIKTMLKFGHDCCKEMASHAITNCWIS